MALRARERFLLPEVVAQLAAMELRAATVVEGVMAGLHRSPFRGMSIEFAEYRRYQPGDDLRRIDWRAYARSDRYYIKEYEDETNLDATLVLDASKSMDFGSGAMTKWQYAGTLAASLAYLLQRQQDNVGLIVLDEAIRLQREARNTRGHLIRVIGEIERSHPARETRLAEVLHQVAVQTRRQGMTIVISDLLDEPEAVVAALRHVQFSGGDIVVLHTLDPAELLFNFEGPMRFIDPESNGMVSALAQEVREGYLQALNSFLAYYREELGKTNIAYSLVDTSAPLDHALLAFLGASARRAGS